MSSPEREKENAKLDQLIKFCKKRNTEQEKRHHYIECQILPLLEQLSIKELRMLKLRLKRKILSKKEP